MAEVGLRKAAVKVLDRPLLDLTEPMGKAMLGLLSAIAEDERLRRQAQAIEGRKRAENAASTLAAGQSLPLIRGRKPEDAS